MYWLWQSLYYLRLHLYSYRNKSFRAHQSRVKPAVQYQSPVGVFAAWVSWLMTCHGDDGTSKSHRANWLWVLRIVENLLYVTSRVSRLVNKIVPFDSYIFNWAFKPGRAVSDKEWLRNQWDCFLAWHSFWVTKGKEQLPCSTKGVDTKVEHASMTRAHDSRLLAVFQKVWITPCDSRTRAGRRGLCSRVRL